MTKAELIVRTLEIVGRYGADSTDTDETSLRYAHQISIKYANYRDTLLSRDWLSAARKARIEVVQEILDLPE